MVNTEEVGMMEATRTREAFNVTRKEACDTFEIEICHEEQQKAIDLFFDGKDVFISFYALALPTVN